VPSANGFAEHVFASCERSENVAGVGEWR
jgi:hypothetical protein